MRKLKLTMLGGGSLYFQSAMAEIACTPELAGSEIVLFDIDEERLDLMRRVGDRIAEKTESGVTVRATTERGDALDGTDFAVASIGVHGPGHRWHKADTDAVEKLGIIMTTGDTVGPSGLSQALRIIPIFVDIAQDMEKYCPDAFLLNHSNPMSAICRAVNKYTSIRAIGYCHNVAGDLRYFAKVLEIPWQELDVTAAGPNHCVWLLDIRHQGRDVYPDLKERLAAQEPPERHRFQQEVLDLFGFFPIGGDRHIVEFFPHARRATATTDIHYGLKWRSDMISEGALARELSDEPQEIELRASGEKDVWLPEENTPEAMGLQIKSLAFGPDLAEPGSLREHPESRRDPERARLGRSRAQGAGRSERREAHPRGGTAPTARPLERGSVLHPRAHRRRSSRGEPGESHHGPRLRRDDPRLRRGARRAGRARRGAGRATGSLPRVVIPDHPGGGGCRDPEPSTGTSGWFVVRQ